MTISAGAYACTERDKRILQNTISSTERGAMISWIESDCYWPVPNAASDADVKRLFQMLGDKKGGFVKIVFVTVNMGSTPIPHQGEKP